MKKNINDFKEDSISEIERIERNKERLQMSKNQNKEFFKNIGNLQNYLFYSVCDYTVSSKDINETLGKQDKDYLSLVSDDLVENIYPIHKGRYVYGEPHECSMIYFDTHKGGEGAIPFTMILDREFMHLNTIINIMDKNDGELSNYADLFSYTYYLQLYTYILNICSAFYNEKNIYPFFNRSKFIDDLMEIDLNQLFILKCFAEARISLSDVKDREEEYDVRLLDYVNDIIFEAYIRKDKTITHGHSRRS